VFVGAAPVATVLGQWLITPDPNLEYLLGWGEQGRSGVFCAWAAVVFLVGFAPEWVRSARRVGLPAAARRWAAAAACGLAAGALGNAVVPTRAEGILHLLIWLALLGVVGVAGVLITAIRLSRRWRRRRRASGGGP
jgi:hypothetical protein